MRYESAIHRAMLVALLASLVLVFAQRTTAEHEAIGFQAFPTITPSRQAVAHEQAQTLGGDSEFRALNNLVLSADGLWMAAEERRGHGDGNVRVWSTESDVTFTIERGQHPRISPDSRWVSVLQRPSLGDPKAANSTSDRTGQTLVLLDTQNGSRTTFDRVLSYDVAHASAWLVYLQSPETRVDEEGPSADQTAMPPAEPTAKDRRVGTLHMVHLESDKVVTTENVSQHASLVPAAVRREGDQPTDYFAYVVRDEETGRDTLRVCILVRDGLSGIRAWYNGENIGGLRWARETVTLGFLERTETADEDGKRRVNRALYTWKLSSENRREADMSAEFTQVSDVSEFRALHNLVISADGAWMAAEERSDRGDGNVRVWSTERDVTFTIERAQNPRISPDSRWLSALQKPPLEDSRTARPKNKRAGQTLVLLDTQDGSRKTLDFVLSYDVTKSSSTGSWYLVYLQSPEWKADEEEHSGDEPTKPAARERTVGTLHVVHSESGNVVITTENVAQYATHQTTNHVAFVVHDCQIEWHAHEETGRDSLHIAGFSQRNWGMNAVYDGEKIEGLCWARDGLTLGFLDSTETTSNDEERRVNSALYTWQWVQPPERRDRGAGFTRVDWGAGFKQVNTPQ